MKTIILFVVAAFAACNSVHSNSNTQANKAPTPAPTVAHDSDGIRRVTTDELAELMKEGKVVVVDVRNKESYDRGHIPGAKLIPVNEVGERAKELPKDKAIVTYCS